MADQIPGIKVDQRTIIFRRLEDILRAYPPLARVKTWQTGRADDPAERLVPSSGLLPLLRMMPTSTIMRQAAQGLRHHEFGVYVELITPGMSHDDFMNLWGEVENALVLARDLGPQFNGKSVFEYIRCGRAATDPLSGANGLYIQQDALFGVTEKSQPIGRYGSGLVMIPFLKQS